MQCRRVLAGVVAVLVVVATVGLAGCLGGGDGDPTPTVDRSAEAIRADALAAIDGVDTYRMNATIVREVSGRTEHTSRVNSRGAIDRNARELRIDQTIDAGEDPISIETYVVDGAVYGHSEVYETEYGDEWIVRHPENFTRRWAQTDTLARQRTLLAMADVEVTGTETVDGRPAYVLSGEVDPGAYEEEAVALFGERQINRSSLTVRTVSITVWVATDTHRPLRSQGQIDLTVDAEGQTLVIDQTFDIRFRGYGDHVTVDLPAAASNAVEVGSDAAANRTGRVAPGGEKAVDDHSAVRRPHAPFRPLVHSLPGDDGPVPTETGPAVVSRLR